MSRVAIVTSPRSPSLHLADVRYLAASWRATCLTTRCGRQITEKWTVELSDIEVPSRDEMQSSGRQWCFRCARSNGERPV